MVFHLVPDPRSAKGQLQDAEWTHSSPGSFYLFLAFRSKFANICAHCAYGCKLNEGQHMRIGFVVNPVAGLGGKVGLKGTDGPQTIAEALRRGADAKSGERARAALAVLAKRVPGAKLTLAQGALGEDWSAGLDLQVTIAGPAALTGTARDTKEAVRAMRGHDIIVFAGGDGTARDIASVVGEGAILGIPCGVKMHSGVFAVTPRAAGAMIADLLVNPTRFDWIEDAEVMDIDEDALRSGVLAPCLYGLARVPVSRSLMQASKGGPRQDATGALSSAAAEIVAGMDVEALYVIGPGTSARAVAEAAGQTSTTLGVDAMIGRKIVAHDVDSASLLRLAKDRKLRVVLGVTGQQGFLLGRGNQQIGIELLRKAGRERLMILATEDKLTQLSQPRLLVDTGAPDLDAQLAGFVRVTTGKGREMMMRIDSC